MGTPSGNGSGLNSGVGYRFGDFEYDPRRRELRKYGIRLRLRRQSLAILLRLLESPGALVSRDELRAHIWGDDTFVDFGQALNSGIKRLRDALCDSSDHPRYIETVSGQGYRFIAPVEIVPAVQVQPGIAAVPAALPSPVAATARATQRRRLWLSAATCIGLLLFSAVILATRRLPASAVPNARSSPWVLIADFENRTGNAILDGVLQSELERELTNSRFVRVVPRERISDALALMRRPPDTRIDQEVGREICLRDGGINFLLVGRAEKLASSYIFSVSIVNPRTGETLHSSTAEARDEEHVIRAFHNQGDDLRSALGEELAQIASSDLQYEKVETPSLRALQLYSEADRMSVDPGNRRLAIGLLEAALKEDPDFASAHRKLAHLYSGRQQFALARRHYERAMLLADSVSERENLFIRAEYFEQKGELQKARVLLEQLLLLYPDDYWATKRLFLITGRPELIYRLADLRPTNFRDVYFAWAKALDTTDPRAHRYYQQYLRIVTAELLEVNPDAAMVFLMPVLDDLARTDIVAADRDLADIESKYFSLGPRASTVFALGIANAYIYMGRLRKAEEWLSRVNTYDRKKGTAQVADARGEPGAVDRWKPLVGADPDVAFRVADLGDPSYVKRILRDGPGCASFRLYQGICDLADGKTNDAIAVFADAADHENFDPHIEAVSLLAHQQERMGDFDGAIASLERIQPNPTLPAMNIALWGLEIRFHLAQLYRRRGHIADAEKVESELRSLLRDADPDFALRQRLAAIPSVHVVTGS